MSDKHSDSFTFEILENYLEIFINYSNIIKDINKKLKNKKIRQPNFPSEISENIVKFAINKIYNKNIFWDISKGDLFYDNIKIEIKGFSSKGPTSFGPKENWDILYFVDCINYKSKKFIIYEIKLSNKDKIFRDIKITKNNSFGEIADNNERGRLRASFNKFKNQLNNYCKIIFEGHLNELK